MWQCRISILLFYQDKSHIISLPTVPTVYQKEYKAKQELQKVLKFPTETFWDLEAIFQNNRLHCDQGVC